MHSIYYNYSFVNGIFIRIQGTMSLLLNVRSPIQLHCKICDKTIKNTLTWKVNFDVKSHKNGIIINSIKLFCNGHNLYISKL